PNSRGLGVADIACALKSGRVHRANSKLAYHVLEAMPAFQEASTKERTVTLNSKCNRYTLLPLDLRDGDLDLQQAR
ncbi:MAG: gfo/Idh/MocA family oxidoreductase, partial [Candidatus Bathyarchaeota archaeon]|nr:gfo/Idh/MocA family oxidoreductase [Candidatus Bathyarchaeota archaeon]